MTSHAALLLALALAPRVAVAADVAAASAQLRDAKNQPVGAAILRETPNGVVIGVDLHGLPPGTHGFHIHTTGKCEAPFESAGSHLNPTGKKHGWVSPNGAHAGDLPNLVVPPSGAVKAEFFAAGVTLQPGKPGSLLDQDGSALVVHAGPDDYATDPAGNSGARIACGVIQATGGSAGAAKGSGR